MNSLLSLSRMSLMAIALFASHAVIAADYLTSEESRAAGLPFSEAVRTNGMLYLSGQIPVDPATGNIVEGDIEAQARQTMDNIKAVLERYGSSMDKVVKCTVFLADISEWGAMNEVYKTYFKNPPARSALGASGLALNARVEIECIATM